MREESEISVVKQEVYGKYDQSCKWIKVNSWW